MKTNFNKKKTSKKKLETFIYLFIKHLLLILIYINIRAVLKDLFSI